MHYGWRARGPVLRYMYIFMYDVTGRSQAAVCTWKGAILVVGGCDAWNCTNTVERYDPDSDHWETLPSMAVARRGAGVAIFDGKVQKAC